MRRKFTIEGLGLTRIPEALTPTMRDLQLRYLSPSEASDPRLLESLGRGTIPALLQEHRPLRPEDYFTDPSQVVEGMRQLGQTRAEAMRSAAEQARGDTSQLMRAALATGAAPSVMQAITGVGLQNPYGEAMNQMAMQRLAEAMAAEQEATAQAPVLEQEAELQALEAQRQAEAQQNQTRLTLDQHNQQQEQAAALANVDTARAFQEALMAEEERFRQQWMDLWKTDYKLGIEEEKASAEQAKAQADLRKTILQEMGDLMQEEGGPAKARAFLNSGMVQAVLGQEGVAEAASALQRYFDSSPQHLQQSVPAFGQTLEDINGFRNSFSSFESSDPGWGPIVGRDASFLHELEGRRTTMESSLDGAIEHLKRKEQAYRETDEGPPATLVAYRRGFETLKERLEGAVDEDGIQSGSDADAYYKAFREGDALMQEEVQRILSERGFGMSGEGGSTRDRTPPEDRGREAATRGLQAAQERGDISPDGEVVFSDEDDLPPQSQSLRAQAVQAARRGQVFESDGVRYHPVRVTENQISEGLLREQEDTSSATLSPSANTNPLRHPPQIYSRWADQGMMRFQDMDSREDVPILVVENEDGTEARILEGKQEIDKWRKAQLGLQKAGRVELKEARKRFEEEEGLKGTPTSMQRRTTPSGIRLDLYGTGGDFLQSKRFNSQKAAEEFLEEARRLYGI